MKKLFAILFALILCMSLVACGSPDTSGDMTFKETLVVDTDECTIKITEIDPDDFWGYTIKAYLENKSSEKTYMFSVTSLAVNGVQVTPLFAEEVTPGKKANVSILFAEDTLKAAGISKYTDIEITFSVYDTNDWLADNVVTETIHIYPYGETEATLYVRAPLSSDIVLVDNEYVTATVIGYNPNNLFGYSVEVFLVNKTNTEVMFSVDDASVNGFMLDPYFAKSVNAGKCTFDSISFSIEDSGITTIEEIEFILRAYDFNNILAPDFANESVELIPQA